MGKLNTAKKWFLLNSGGGDPTINSDGQEVWLSIGHSIAQGTASGSGQPTCAAGTVYVTVDGVTISEITNDDVNPIRGFSAGLVGSAWPAFGNARYASTGRKPVIILRGIGNSVFLSHASATGGDWNPANSNYTGAKAAALAAIETLGVSRLAGIIVNLGINDINYSNTFANISTAIDSTFSALLSDFPNTPIYIVMQGSSSGSNSLKNRQVKNKLRTIASENANIYIGASMTSFQGNSLLDDGTHPNVAGYTMLGQMINRLVGNSGYSKFARAIISSHHDELSAGRKNAIQSFISEMGAYYFSMESILRYKTTVAANLCVDYTLLNHPQNLAAFTANDSIDLVRATPTYVKTGFVPSFQLFSGQNDIIVGGKVKTNAIVAGTQAYLFGGNDGTVTVGMYQWPSNGLVANIGGRYTIWQSTEGGEGAFAADAWYFGATDGTNAYIIKGDEVKDQDTTTVTTGLLSKEIYSGAHNNNGSPANGMDDKLLNFVAVPYSSELLSTLVTAMDNLDASW